VKDLKELETRIYPKYEEMASDVQTEKLELKTKYGKLTTAADQQGEVWHREITAVVKKKKLDIEEMKSKHLAVLDKQSDELTHRITKLRQIIQDLKKILDSSDVTLASTYNSRNGEFRQLPPKVRVTLPSFSWPTINTDQLHQLFGSLSPSSVVTEQGYLMTPPTVTFPPPIKPVTSPEAVMSLPIKSMKLQESPMKSLLDEPRLITTIDTGNTPRSVCCLSEAIFWTCGNNKIMKLINIWGRLHTSIQTKSGNWPRDIAVTRGGNLVYTDDDDKNVNLVKNKKIQTLITLQRWKPLNVCNTSFDDLLVTMISDDKTQSKIVRYSGSTETQTIQFDDQGLPLYSSGDIKYVSENRNLDICVADNGAEAVVVVNQSGKFRFRYTGHTKDSFDPVGITTDSQSHILISDCRNHRIHILDQHGKFLRYIQNCDLRRPWGLSVDARDDLFVAEINSFPSFKVKIIRYI
jgi:hypothetical protein